MSLLVGIKEKRRCRHCEICAEIAGVESGVQTGGVLQYIGRRFVWGAYDSGWFRCPPRFLRFRPVFISPCSFPPMGQG